MGIQSTLEKPDPEQHAAPDPLIRFYRLIQDTPLPQRADRSAGGLIPTRAFRYCEPMTAASAFGWYIFPPMNFQVLWTGSELFWQFDECEDWLPLGAAQYPYFSDFFDDHCPKELMGYAPPFISAAPEPGVLKVWSGLFARTRPGWSSLVRKPANLPGHQTYEHYEGIIETDRWFGPLFMNFRLTKTDQPIFFQREMPLFQVQPVERLTYQDKTLNNFETIASIDDFTNEDWNDYYQLAVAPGTPQERPRGLYARSSRKNRTPSPEK
ncbi:DUF6065 family protein [Sneathiella limimaris]|uniref:DUF6065 family protein n=1 Tax=Sneathiella limimaris TaxID=1964213 RepID=UPI00146DCC19|nr:DUF6065 family protein [Sneathiella limimaris]